MEPMIHRRYISVQVKVLLMKKKVLLLNPPARKGVIRDYYCSHLAKGNYLWLPQDLLVFSGMLQDDCDLSVIDAMVMPLSEDKTLEEIQSFSPDIIICMVAAVNWRSDMRFLSKLSQKTSALIIVSGDYSRIYPRQVLTENTCIDAIVLDFSHCGILSYVFNPHSDSIVNIMTRESMHEEIVAVNEACSYPPPRHDLFPIKRYHLPHIQCHPFTTILTTFGCMHACSYCPYERIPFKLRTIESIEQELRSIKSMGIRELFFRDQCFGSHREQAYAVCRLFEEVSHPFSWSCEMRTDKADETLLKAMKKSGCHTIMFGVESASENILRKHNKNISLQRTKEAFHLAKQLGIRTLAHVIVGMQGEDELSLQRLIDFCIELDPNYVSFNIANPAWDTSFRDALEKNNKIFDPKIEVDHSIGQPVWESSQLSARQVWEFRNRAIRKFYLRPTFVIREFFGAKSHYRRKMMLKAGLEVLLNHSV